MGRFAGSSVHKTKYKTQIEFHSMLFLGMKIHGGGGGEEESVLLAKGPRAGLRH